MMPTLAKRRSLRKACSRSIAATLVQPQALAALIAAFRTRLNASAERPLRIRYDRLRRARSAAVVVPLNGDTCGACFTAIPKNRRSQIRAGVLLEGCEACGVILYSAEQ